LLSPFDAFRRFCCRHASPPFSPRHFHFFHYFAIIFISFITSLAFSFDAFLRFFAILLFDAAIISFSLRFDAFSPYAIILMPRITPPYFAAAATPFSPLAYASPTDAACDAIFDFSLSGRRR
jgi:hypothetical protein